MDSTLTHWINAAAGQNGAIDSLMIGMATLGLPLLVAGIAFLWWSKEDRAHMRHSLAATGLAAAGGLAINQLILVFVHRVRPYDAGASHLIIHPSADWSFPSDHATVAFAIAAAFALQGQRRWTSLILIASVAIAVSRVYVGTHYLTDVLGGALTGIAAAAVVRLCLPRGTRLDRLLMKLP